VWLWFEAVQDALAALPVGEGRAGLHAVVGQAGGDEAFLDDQLGSLEAGLEIAIDPLLGGLAERQLVVARGGKVARLPFGGLQVDLRRRDVAVGAGIGAAGKQALQRVGGHGANCSKSILIASIASAAISSVSAATARIGSPT